MATHFCLINKHYGANFITPFLWGSRGEFRRKYRSPCFITRSRNITWSIKIEHYRVLRGANSDGGCPYLTSGGNYFDRSLPDRPFCQKQHHRNTQIRRMWIASALTGLRTPQRPYYHPPIKKLRLLHNPSA